MEKKRRIIDNTKKATLFVTILMLGLLFVNQAVVADQQEVTFTFLIPTNIAHTISYNAVDGGTACTASLFIFVENDSTYDGNAVNIYPSATGADDDDWCQNRTVGSMTVTVDGNVAVALNASFESLPTGIYVRGGINHSALIADIEPCTGVAGNAPDNNTCLAWENGDIGNKTMFNHTASGATQDLWFNVNMSNFNSGAAGNTTATYDSNAITSI